MSEIGDAIFDTEIDRFITGAWPDRQLDLILKLLKQNHPELNMARYEKRPRKYATCPEERQAILIIDRVTNIVVSCFHWDSRGYARAWEPEKYFFVKYIPPDGMDFTDVMDRNEPTLWNGKGEVLENW